MADRDTRVSVPVTEDKSEMWKEKAKEIGEIEAGTKAGLVRKAVNEFVSRHEQGQSLESIARHNNGGVDEETLDRLDDVVTAIEGLDNRLDDVVTAVEGLDERLALVEEEVVPGKDIESSDIVGALPASKPYSDEWEYLKENTDRDDIVWQGTVEALADHFGVKELVVNEKLERAQDMLEFAVINGETRFWTGVETTAILEDYEGEGQ